MPTAPLHFPDTTQLTKPKTFSKKWFFAIFLLFALPFFFETSRPYISLPNHFHAFVGREEILNSIKKTLFARSNKQPIIALWGEGGIGKSEIAIEFANRNINKFSLIYWVNVGSEEIYEQSYYNLAHHFEIPNYASLPFEKVRDQVHDQLENRKFNKPWLLIFDNADHTVPLPHRGHGKILITTRDRAAWDHAQSIAIPTLNSQEANELYKKLVDKEVSTDWQALAEELNYFPLALYQALNYVKQSPNFSIHDYLLMAKRSKKALFKQTLTDSRYPHNLLAVWQMNAVTMKATYPKAYAWLQICAYLHPDKIPMEWLEKWLILEGESESEAKGQAHDILRLFSNQGVIRLNRCTHSFSLHRLKQELMKQEHDTNEKFDEKALHFLAQIGKDFDYHERLGWLDLSYEELSNWAMSCTWWLSHNQHDASNIEQKIQLLNGIGNIYVVHHGDYEKNLKLFEEALALVQGEKEAKIYLWLNQGYTYMMMSEFAKTQDCYEKALSLVTTLCPNGSTLEHFRCYLSFADLEYYRSNHQLALEWCEKAKAIENEVFGDTWNAERCEIPKWSGELIRCLGRIDEGIPYILDALNLNKQVFSAKQNVQKLYLLVSLGRALELLEEIDLALACKKKANEIGALWPGSLISIITLHDLAISYRLCGQLKPSLLATRKALTLYKTKDLFYTPSYHYSALGNMGSLYFQYKKYEKALKIFDEIEKTGYLDLEPIACREKYRIWKNYGNTFCALGHYHEGIRCLERAEYIAETLYPNHEFILWNIQNDLFKAYEKIDTERAKIYKIKSEKARAKVYKLSEKQKEEIRKWI